mmetsp:Transcript_20701/g.41417  ORF Transcript_20701/g.41417 Transcript_20701/m.41417 type:complete len:226 (-) Transcript_20701:145-822(-)
MNAALSLPIDSMLTSPRMQFSSVEPLKGKISSAYIPVECALAALTWLRTANSSCSLRVTPKRAAKRSDDDPITSPVEKLAMAGSSRPMSEPLSPLSNFITPGAPFFMAFGAPRARLRRARDRRIGTSEKVSAPPASTTSATPKAISPMPVEIARPLEMHAWLTVWAGTPAGMPAARAASRPRLAVFTSEMTFPQITEDIKLGSNAALSIRPFIANRDMSINCKSW